MISWKLLIIKVNGDGNNDNDIGGDRLILWTELYDFKVTVGYLFQ